MSELKEYVVTLKSKDDLEDFYAEMQSAKGCDCVPEREVEICNKRPLSRNTHFMLTDEESERLSKDERVIAIENPNIYRNSIRPDYVVSGNFNKSNSTSTATHRNWAHYRCVNGETVLNWGSDGNPDLNETANITSSGKNVDVVIIDGHIDPAHPEFAVNEDGSGGTRVVQFDWFTLNNLVSGVYDDDGAGLLTGPYQYAPYVDPSYPDGNNNGVSDRTEDNNHGAHVAGTVAGSRYGWAKDANIYNISPYSTNQNNLDSFAMWDYIRAFHATKSINPVTGRRNPTICNGSYGSAIPFPATFSNGDTTGPITRAVYRGVDTGFQAGGLSVVQLQANGFRTTSNNPVVVPYYSGAIIADIEDAIADGIIVVGSAGNSYWNIAGPGDTDYDNIYYATYNGTNYFWYTSRGSAPGVGPSAICVGAASNAVNEKKAYFSNCGPRVDIYAPGQSILSSLNDGSIVDPRDNNYYVQKYQGTSMSSPQVCGVLACALETYPNMTHVEAKEYLNEYATYNQMFDSGGGIMDEESLQGAPNKYLFFKKERLDDGNVFPKKNYYIRPTRGCVYPRTRIRRRG